METNNTIGKILPVMFAFFIMGFVDLVGISTSYVKADFGLSDTLANFLPMMVFVWFAVFSVPTGFLMNYIGRKNTVLLSMLITVVALLLPLISYSYNLLLVAFALLGIGNTILQVSLNPLVSNIVQQEKLTSYLTLGQFTKAIASFLGPVIAGYAALSLGNWKLVFPIFAGISIISSIWLLLAPIRRDEKIEDVASFGASFSLLGDRTVLLLFLGILSIVGIDVGMNLGTPRFLMERTGLELEHAGLGTSLYFAARTAGALVGAIILARYEALRFLRISTFVAIGAMIIMLLISETVSIFVLVALIGFAVANVFSILISVAFRSKPSRANEISGLMIMGVAGGAILPPLMGILSDIMGQAGGMLVILMALFYLLYISFVMREKA